MIPSPLRLRALFAAALAEYWDRRARALERKAVERAALDC